VVLDAPPLEGRVTRRTRWLVAGALAFGVAARLAQYAARTSIWHDEAFVALNVAGKSWAELLGPLDWGEAAPPGFLAVEKAVVALLGSSEYALRLVPLAGGVVGLLAFAGLAASISGEAAVWSVMMMAAADKLIVQANEVKHFTLDTLLAIVLVALAVRVRRRPSAAAHVARGAAGALSAWLSFASVLVFAGTTLALAPRALRARGERRAFLAAVAIAVASWSLLVAPVAAQRTAVVTEFWSDAFPDVRSAATLVAWMIRALLGFFNYFWQPLGAAVVVLAALGAAAIRSRGQGFELACLWLPAGIALAASFVAGWPFGGNQHAVFAAPAVLLSAGEGLALASRRLGRFDRRLGAAAAIAFLSPGIAPAAWHLVSPRTRHEVRPIIEFVEQHRRADDLRLISCVAEYQFYTGEDVRRLPRELGAGRRAWFVSARSAERPFPEQVLLDRLRHERPLLLAREAPGAAAYLFGPPR
jgi:hypothetical protein